MLGAFSIDAYLPSFHAIGVDLKVDRVAVQQTLTIYLSTFAFMMLFYGTLSDTFGRRRVILWSVLGYTVGSACAGLAPSLGWLLAARALQGLSVGAGSVVGRAVVRDLYPGHEGQKMMAYVMMVFSLAPAVAPVVGGWLEVWFGWRSVFVFLTLASLLILIASFKWLPESLPKEQRQPLHLGTILRTYWQVGSHFSFVFQALGIALMFAGFSVYISTAPEFVMHILKLPETAFAWLFVPIIIGMSSGSWLSAKLSARVDPDKLIWRAYAITGGAAAVNIAYAHLFKSQVPWAVIPPMIYMFGLALASAAMALRVMDLFPNSRGMAASLQGFVQMMLFAAVAGTIAPLVLGSATRLAICLLAGWGLSAACWWLGTRKARPVVIEVHS
jgi:DHA1 family bicyclomycin/chloramphenicol resistance-like MFS transporter